MDIRENRLASSTNYVIRTRQYASSSGETDVCQQKQQEAPRGPSTNRSFENPSRFHPSCVHALWHTAWENIRRVSCSPLKARNRHNNKRSRSTRAAREMRITLCLPYRATSATRRPISRHSCDGAKYFILLKY